MADLLLTDGGLETSLIFHRGVELPQFAAFTLLGDRDGEAHLRAYFAPYLELARRHGTGFVFDTVTWRANPDWAAPLGLTLDDLREANRAAVALARDIAGDTPGVLIDGVLGPRGDGYVVEDAMTADEAEAYHALQLDVFADEDVDLVSAITMTYAEEAAGIARGAAARDLPAVISFTVETDGRLPSGQPLGEAIEQVDAAAPVRHFMVNCAHPTHFAEVLRGEWTGRIGGLRANASRLSHAELDAAEELDEGDPAELAERYAALADRLPNLHVLGGCCGTDDRHVTAIASAWRRRSDGTATPSSGARP